MVNLRPLKKSDAERIAVLLNNKAIWDNLRDRIPLPYLVENAEWFISVCHNKLEEQTFAIEYNQELVGVIGLERDSDIYRENAEIGYWVGEPYWGKGIAHSAIGQALAHGFGIMRLNKITASSFAYNATSIYLLGKNGFKQEGIRPAHAFKNGKFHDEYIFGLLLENYTSL